MAVDTKALAAGGAVGLAGIFADLAYNCYSATNSSPQTTELFANERGGTLMKWVYIGDAQVAFLTGAGFLALTAAGQKSLRWAPVIGAGAVAIIMHGMYVHALKSGQGKNAP